MNNKGKDMNKKNLKLLYRALDSDLDEKKQKQLEKVLKNSAQLRQEKKRILAQRQAISDSATKSFKPFFAERVMSRIFSEGKEENGLEAFYKTLKAAFHRLAIAGAIITVALIIYNLGIGESLSIEEAFYAADVTLEEIIQLPLF